MKKLRFQFIILMQSSHAAKQHGMQARLIKGTVTVPIENGAKCGLGSVMVKFVACQRAWANDPVSGLPSKIWF